MATWESVLREIPEIGPIFLRFLYSYMGISYMGTWPYKFSSIELLNFFLVFNLKWVILNLIFTSENVVINAIYAYPK